MGDGFGQSRPGSLAPRKSRDFADTSQYQASEEFSDQSQGGDIPVTNLAIPNSASSDSTANLPQRINQDVTKLKEVTDANCNPLAVHDQLHGFESQLNGIDTAIKEFDNRNNFLPINDSETNILLSIVELNGDISGDNYEDFQVLQGTGLPIPRKWKKISRDISPTDSLMLSTVPRKRNRDAREETQPEQPNKKCQFFKDNGHDNSMVEAVMQPCQSQ